MRVQSRHPRMFHRSKAPVAVYIAYFVELVTKTSRPLIVLVSITALIVASEVLYNPQRVLLIPRTIVLYILTCVARAPGLGHSIRMEEELR